MSRQFFRYALALLWIAAGGLLAPVQFATVPFATAQEKEENAVTRAEIRVGIIGLDTSHAIAFAKELNSPTAGDDVSGCRVVAAYPQGSADIASSAGRIPKYTEQIEGMGIEIVDSVEALLERVDAVLLETNDGRPHWEQGLAVMRAGKPVFIDKPLAASLVDCVALYEAADHFEVPMFTSSSLRYMANAQAVRNGAIGKVHGCDAYSPASLEPTHPDLFWYGIHGVEALFTVMGTGCEKVTRTSTPDFDLVVGQWQGGRIGTFRGVREGSKGYGGTAFGETGIKQIGPYAGYRPLVTEIVKMFRTGERPIAAEETLEIYAFMEAAEESKRRGGAEVSLQEVMQLARQQAQRKLAAAGIETGD
jgi:hypothetical protein